MQKDLQGVKTRILVTDRSRWPKAVFGLCVLLSILATGCDYRIKIHQRIEPVMYDRSPLIRAMGKLSDAEFEKQVQEHPEWINQKSKHLPDNANNSVLTACAITSRTNQVRILIMHGADVQEAIKWCERYNYKDCMELILKISKELENSKNMAPIKGKQGVRSSRGAKGLPLE